MTETAQQYTQRILAALGGRDPLEVLASTPDRLAGLVNSQPERALTERPAPDKWSVSEILAHLADAELVVSFRIRLILGQPGVAIQAYDQDVWAEFSQYHRIPAEESLQRLAVQRRANLRLLRSLTAEQLQQYGIHSERGRETVSQIRDMWAGHDLNHCAQIEQILSRSAAA